MQEFAHKLDQFSSSSAKIFVDQFGRVFDYLRISIIEQCNFRCLYCMPEKGIRFKKKSELLTESEIIRIIRIVADFGVKKVRLTGGEPLLHPGLVSIVAEAVNVEGIDSVHLTTNGLLLDERIEELKEAGLYGINISLDTFREEKFRNISRRDGLHRVINNIYKAMDIGIPDVKLNVVILRDFNDDELSNFVEFTKSNMVTVRFIELMPFDSHQIWRTGHFMGVELIKDRLHTQYKNLKPTDGSSTEHHVYRIPGYLGKIALIPSYSRSLCSDCTRIRLTADGKLRNCLYSNSEYNVMKLVRNGATNDEIGIYIKQAMWHKLEDGWMAQKTESTTLRSSMTQIGG